LSVHPALQFLYLVSDSRIAAQRRYQDLTIITKVGLKGPEVLNAELVGLGMERRGGGTTVFAEEIKAELGISLRSEFPG
jgi:hypothetical protein